jgi:hypothetical protein
MVNLLLLMVNSKAALPSDLSVFSPSSFTFFLVLRS